MFWRETARCVTLGLFSIFQVPISASEAFGLTTVTQLPNNCVGCSNFAAKIVSAADTYFTIECAMVGTMSRKGSIVN